MFSRELLKANTIYSTAGAHLNNMTKYLLIINCDTNMQTSKFTIKDRETCFLILIQHSVFFVIIYYYDYMTAFKPSLIFEISAIMKAFITLLRPAS